MDTYDAISLCQDFPELHKLCLGLSNLTLDYIPLMDPFLPQQSMSGASVSATDVVIGPL